MNPDSTGFWMLNSSDPPHLRDAVEAALVRGALAVSFRGRLVGANIKELLTMADEVTDAQLKAAGAVSAVDVASAIKIQLPLLAKKRLDVCGACEFGRKGSQLSVCAKKFPHCDCSCMSKINRSATGMALWADMPESACPHPDGNRWAGITVDVAPDTTDLPIPPPAP